MKTTLFYALFLLFSFTLHAQLNVWTGMVDDKWSDENNWTGTVPMPSDDVLIPSGFVVTIDTPVNILSIEVQGNSVLNVTSSLIIANPSEFEDNVVVNWSSGDLGGDGILLNSGTINLSYFSFDLTGSTILNNPGTINMVGGAIGISSNAVLNNSGTGIIDFKMSGSQFGASSGVLNNFGTIKASFPNATDEGFIACDIINHDGIFQIDSGILSLNNTVVNLMGAEFNVSAGAILNLNSPMTVLGTLFGIVFGNLNWNNDLIVPSTAVLDFDGNQIINCTGNLEGGGTLTNLTTINQIGGSAMQITDATTLENQGIIEVTNGPGLAIGNNAIINNNASAIIDLQVDGANIGVIGSSSNTLNNFGLIKASLQNNTDEALISAQLNNSNSTLQVDNGSLVLFNANTTLTEGTYNIAAGANLRWALPITISGALTGNLEGTLEWEADLQIPANASFDFNGTGGVQWQTGLLSGGGTLTNNHTISTQPGPNKIIDGATTLINNAEYRCFDFVRISTNSTLTNSSTGTIDIQTFGSSFGTINNPPHTFTNFGILVASFPANATVISAPINNFGIIEVTSAEIDFTNTLINETSGIIKGAGTIDLPNNPSDFINNGTFAPGLSPGSLSVFGDYSSTASSILEIEINGLTQGSEYDVLTINGDADLDGAIQITLGFNPDINDTFIFTTVSGTINTCNLPSTVTASFGGFNYGFDLVCGTNNELLVTVVSETLGVESFDQEPALKLYPNPATSMVSFSNKTIEKITLFDITGKFIKHANSYTISIEELPSGIYILKGTDSKNTSISKKLIKL